MDLKWNTTIVRGTEESQKNPLESPPPSALKLTSSIPQPQGPLGNRTTGATVALGPLACKAPLLIIIVATEVCQTNKGCYYLGWWSETCALTFDPCDTITHPCLSEHSLDFIPPVLTHRPISVGLRSSDTASKRTRYSKANRTAFGVLSVFFSWSATMQLSA